MSDWLIRDFLNVAPLIYICISCPNTASKRAQKQSCVLTVPSECQSDLKLVLWSRHESVHPWSWNEISAIGEDWCQSSAHNTLKTSWKNVSGTRRSLITVTFRYQIDGSGSWHWTSALLITLRWVGSADQRGGPHRDRPIHSEKRSQGNRRCDPGEGFQSCTFLPGNSWKIIQRVDKINKEWTL